MSTQTIWLYGVCTFQDVAAEQDDPSINMDTMSAPQVAIIAPGYSEAIVRELATEALDEITVDDDPAVDLRGMSLDDLDHVMSCVSPENDFVFEVTAHDYYDPADGCHLIRVVVQERSVRSTDNQVPNLTEHVSVRRTAPGDS